ncbi:hypothetical protein M0Q97_13600 [Candidatus Dojkabacteria bacterium]|jgi:hypothetical protein|nr:hypothetical protein [Candidatus Dojkabacteria bacterium]
MIKDYKKNCSLYKISLKYPMDYPLILLARVITEGSEGNCPQCNSTTTYGFFGQIARLFGSKKYCINDSCIYHYFDIRKDDGKFENKKQLLSFIKNREREAKLKRIVK